MIHREHAQSSRQRSRWRPFEATRPFRNWRRSTNFIRTLITQWKRQAVEKLAKVFEDKGFEVQANRDAEVTKLQAKSGQLVVERDLLAKAFDR